MRILSHWDRNKQINYKDPEFLLLVGPEVSLSKDTKQVHTNEVHMWPVVECGDAVGSKDSKAAELPDFHRSCWHADRCQPQRPHFDLEIPFPKFSKFQSEIEKPFFVTDGEK